MKTGNGVYKTLCPQHVFACSPHILLTRFHRFTIRGKRGIIQLNNHRILRKVNQVIYTIYPNSMPDIMILAKAVSIYFVDKIALLYKMPKLEKGDNSAKY